MCVRESRAPSEFEGASPGQTPTPQTDNIGPHLVKHVLARALERWYNTALEASAEALLQQRLDGTHCLLNGLIRQRRGAWSVTGSSQLPDIPPILCGVQDAVLFIDRTEENRTEQNHCGVQDDVVLSSEVRVRRHLVTA